MNTISEEKLDAWRNLIAEKKQSSLRVNDFCKEKNITPAQFYYYHAMINRSKKSIAIKQGNAKVTPIKIVNPVPLEQSSIRFILPNSLQCVLPRNMPLQEIKAMLEVLLSC